MLCRWQTLDRLLSVETVVSIHSPSPCVISYEKVRSRTNCIVNQVNQHYNQQRARPPDRMYTMVSFNWSPRTGLLVCHMKLPENTLIWFIGVLPHYFKVQFFSFFPLWCIRPFLSMLLKSHTSLLHCTSWSNLFKCSASAWRQKLWEVSLGEN